MNRNVSDQKQSWLTAVRALVGKFDAAAIGQCLNLVVRGETNPCFRAASEEEVVTVLARAAFVAEQIQQGLTMGEAIRELGRRMRSLK
jgi:hypothetical protein